MFLFLTTAFSSVTTVTASFSSLTRRSFSVSAGDYVVVVFPDQDGFVIAGKPNPTSFNIAQGCTDPCSSSCSWFHHSQSGILSLGGFRGVVEYYATSSGTLFLTYGYVYPNDAYWSSEQCTEIYVNAGPSTVLSTWTLDANSVACFFESDTAGYIASTKLARSMSLYTNSGFSRISYQTIERSWAITGVLVHNSGSASVLGGELDFTSQYDEYQSGCYFSASTSRAWPDPIVFAAGGIGWRCIAGRNGVEGSCNEARNVGIIIGATVGSVAIIGGIVVLVLFLWKRKQAHLPTEKLLSGNDGQQAGYAPGFGYDAGAPYPAAPSAGGPPYPVAPPPFLPNQAPPPYPAGFA
jgi:hypothetical protein